MRLRLIHSTILGGVLAIALTGTSLAEWPERPITWIVPWGAGGAADQITRVLAPAMEKELGVPINVVLQPGGSGAVGHTALAAAAPDGYTWGLGTVEITMLHWQGLADITPESFTTAAIVNTDAGGLVVGKDSPYNDAKALLEAVKTSPAGTFKASGTGQGGIWHLGLAGWLLAEGVDPKVVSWVPNQGAGPSMQDLVAGGVAFTTNSLAEGRNLIDAGEARAIANMGKERHGLYPDVPTIAESTGTDYSIQTWRGVFGPAGIPDDIVSKFVAALDKARQTDQFTDVMKKGGFGIAWIVGPEAVEFVNNSDTTLGSVMREAGLSK
jgi:tripartite-type tricarboxylate transporter receptor subunit TctC